MCCHSASGVFVAPDFHQPTGHYLLISLVFSWAMYHNGQTCGSIIWGEGLLPGKPKGVSLVLSAMAAKHTVYSSFHTTWSHCDLPLTTVFIVLVYGGTIGRRSVLCSQTSLMYQHNRATPAPDVLPHCHCIRDKTVWCCEQFMNMNLRWMGYVCIYVFRIHRRLAVRK